MENFLNNNEVFTVDLSSMNSPADVVFELTHVLDDNKAFGKKISLKLADIDLSKAQLLSLKSLISSINSDLYYIESPSNVTIASAQSIGIETPSNPPIQEAKQIKETVITAHDFTTDSEIKLSAEDETKKYINIDMFNSENSDVHDFSKESIAKEQENTKNSLDIKTNENVLEDFNPAEQNYENIVNSDIQESYTEEHPEEFASQESVLNKIEQSIEFDELAQSSNVQTDIVQDALSGIYNTEKKLENILDNGTEQTTIDLAEPLDTSYTEEDKEIDNMSVKYVKQTIRSGNVITSEGNLVIIGDCHPGSEIHAAGDITVWGMLGGIAHAGNKGNKRAKVRALKLNPIQLRIANLYTRRPDALHTIYNEKTSVFTPEEARIINEEIVIYTMNER